MYKMFSSRLFRLPNYLVQGVRWRKPDKSFRERFKRFGGSEPPVELGGDQLSYINMPEFAMEPRESQKSFSELKAEADAMLPLTEHSVDIGFGYKGIPNKRKQMTTTLTKNSRDADMEKKSRLQQLEVSLREVRQEWLEECGPVHERTIAEHYGIFRDLFDGGYFHPVVPLTVAYDYDEEFITPVYTGNHIPPIDTSNAPHIEFDSDEHMFYSLLMTNPDGHLQNNEAEYLHWAVGNFKGVDVSTGELLCDYLQPFPVRGTGHHRFIFILSQHESPLDFSSIKRQLPCVSLAERTFSSKKLYESFEGKLCPVGLRFFQSEWDRSVSDVYHKILNMKEPEFEYMHPPPYHPPQGHYAHNQPFDRYYDRYRDKKDLREEVLKLKLNMISPYEEHPTRFKYPNVHNLPYHAIHNPKEQPFSWLRRRQELINRRLEQYKDLPK